MSTSRTSCSTSESLAVSPLDLFSRSPPTASPNHIQIQVYSPVQPVPRLPPDLHPPPSPPIPPLIYHIVVPYGLLAPSPSLIALLHTHTHLPVPLLAQLADLGALYLRAGPPSPRISPRPLRQTHADALLPLPLATPLYIRLHASPKRHAARSPLRVVGRIADVIALCKPKGLPAVPTSDNAVECATAHAASLLGVSRVHVTTRLDACTSGVLLVGLSAAAARAANVMLRDPGCTKTYEVDTWAQPRVGVLRHWMCKRSVGEVRTWGEWPGEGWVIAELEVRGVREGVGKWESCVRLVTGRTHQIRVQFAKEGWPVCGDHKYGRVREREDPRRIGLHAARVEGVLNGERVVFEAEKEEWEETAMSAEGADASTAEDLADKGSEDAGDGQSGVGTKETT